MIGRLTLSTTPLEEHRVPFAGCQYTMTADSTSFPVTHFFPRIFLSFKYSGMALNKNAISLRHSGE